MVLRSRCVIYAPLPASSPGRVRRRNNVDAQQVDIQPTDQELNPKPLLTKIDIKNKQGQVVGQKDYLGAHEAITWFHADYPLPIGRILTFPDFEHHAVRAEIWVGDVLIATGHSISEGS